MASSWSLSYHDRGVRHRHQVTRKLFEIAVSKKTNSIVSADVRSTKELLQLADILGPYIAVFKTHIDLVNDFGDETLNGLQTLKTKHNFLIFEDRKFVDIGHTVQQQYQGGALRISEWSDIVNASVLAGPDTVRALSKTMSLSSARSSANEEHRAILVLAEMTTAGSLATGSYTAAAIESARQNPESVIGFISYPEQQAEEDMVVFTTGISEEPRSDTLGQTYQTPAEAIARGSDFLIVGRGIYKHLGGPIAAAKRYRALGWEAYHVRVGTS